MFSAPNDYFIASRKFIKDEISIQESLVKWIGTIVDHNDATRIFTS